MTDDAVRIRSSDFFRHSTFVISSPAALATPARERERQRGEIHALLD
jgi:hypothetical protein